MSNIAQLRVSNKSGAPIVDADWDAEEEKDYINLPVLESEDVIPIFWLLLFKKSDLKYYNDPDEEGKLPYLVTTIEKAKQNFTERIPELTKMIRNIDDFTDEWKVFLNLLPRKYVKVDLYEILELSENGFSELAPALTAFDEFSPESITAFVSLTCLSDIIHQETMTIRESTPKLVRDLLPNDKTFKDDPKYYNAALPTKPLLEYVRGYGVRDWVPWQDVSTD
jgi:hypothetical protein